VSISEVTVSPSVLDEHVAEIEARIRRDFLRRLHEFHILLRDNTLELEGRSNTYHVKQIVQKAVSNTTHLRIRANNIVVDVATQPSNQVRHAVSNAQANLQF